MNPWPSILDLGSLVIAGSALALSFLAFRDGRRRDRARSRADLASERLRKKATDGSFVLRVRPSGDAWSAAGGDLHLVHLGPDPAFQLKVTVTVSGKGTNPVLMQFEANVVPQSEPGAQHRLQGSTVLHAPTRGDRGRKLAPGAPNFTANFAQQIGLVTIDDVMLMNDRERLVDGEHRAARLRLQQAGDGLHGFWSRAQARIAWTDANGDWHNPSVHIDLGDSSEWIGWVPRVAS